MGAEAAPNIKVVIDGKEVVFADQKPFINADSRTMVPVRAPMEAIGCAVEWDGDNNQAIISRGDIVAVFTIGSNNYTANGLVKMMDTVPEIVNSRTVFPIRFCAEVFGATVGWDPVTYTVTIATEKEQVVKPDPTSNIVQATPEQIEQISKVFDTKYWRASKMIGGDGSKSFSEMSESEKNIAMGLLSTGIIKQDWIFATDENLAYRSGKSLYYLNGILTYSSGIKKETIRAKLVGCYENGSYSGVEIFGYDTDTGKEVFEDYL